jgi:hypothetical protein
MAHLADVVDRMLTRYVDWREDAAAVRDAYRCWAQASSGQGSWRFVAYMASLEQEESSATEYALALAEVGDSLQPN